MSDRAELLKLHDWDELLFGGFYCLRCTPDDEDNFDDPIAWPCQPLRDAGLTDDEAREIVVAHREKVEAEYRAKKAAEQAEAQRQVNEFNHHYPVGTLVFAYPGCRPEDGTGTRLVTRTRTEAQLSSSGYPVVWVEGEGAYICLTHVDPVSEDVWEAAREAEKPVEPEAAPESAARLSPEREAEIRDYIATCTNWSLDAIAARDLLAELAAVRAERDQAQVELTKYVGKEPTIAEEMDYLARCLTAVEDVCSSAEKQATRRENPLPVPEWVEHVRVAARGERHEDLNDNRRRLFVDGKGNGWISVCHDDGTEWIVPVQPEAAVEQDVRDIADETGSVREIGRCW